MLFVLFDLRLVARRFERGRDRLKQSFLLENFVELQAALGERALRTRESVYHSVDQLAVVQTPLKLIQISVKLGQLFKHAAQLRALELDACGLYGHGDVFRGLAHEELLQLFFVAQILLAATLLDLKQRRLRDVDVAVV